MNRASSSTSVPSTGSGPARRLPNVKFYSGADDTGMDFEVNAAEPIPFENEVFVGTVLFLHRPESEKSNYRYASHFRDAERRWELRCQGVFKTDPGEVFFGAEIAEDMTASRARRLALTALAKVVTKWAAMKGMHCHYSCSQRYLHDGSEVRPHFVAPILSAQAIVVTPKGERPPRLQSPFEATPFHERSQIHLNTDDTFTFCFWLKQLDFARWELCHMPFRPDRSFDYYIGETPIHLIGYCINRSECEGDVHAECNKHCVMRLVISAPAADEACPTSPKTPLRNLGRTLSRGISDKFEQLFDRQAPMPSVRMITDDWPNGKLIEVNSSSSIKFETALFSGEVLFLQRPTPEPFHNKWPYAAHFKPTLRRWEMRCQGKFKRLVAADNVFFGAEMRHDTTLGWSKRSVAQWVVKVAKMLAASKGVWFDYCLSMTKQDDGSLVLPHYVSPMCAAEAVYATPPGKSPPVLTESIPFVPLAEKQSIKVNLQDTYTIALWNKQLDFAKWQICNMPFGWSAPVSTYVGEQPINLVAYSLKNPNVDGDPHVDSNKDYILRLEVTPPSSSSQWSCHSGVKSQGIVLGRAAAKFHETAEKVAPRTLARVVPAGDGEDLRAPRYKKCYPWLPKCFAWCQ